ncbi:MATE family efflux transporter [bacterium]|nr:MATE family efflux transporter [bacterium]MDC1275383.1 MATE family efflux transporter [Ascidiaceihabitans sp.]HCI08630.1 MATE family efflux transporter [Sulfitobacter sp.]
MRSKAMSYPAHAKAVAILGLPLVGGHLAQIAIGVTDTVMLGWYGVDALAAVTLAASYFFVLFLMGAGFAFAVMPMVATFDAEEDEVSIRRVTRMGLWLSIAYSVAIMPIMIWSESLFLFLGQEPTVAADAQQYLRIAGFGMFPWLVAMVIKSYLAALERTQVVFWIAVLATVCNGLINYALIFGNWGAPEMGIQGAAIASVFTQLVGMLGVVVYAILVLPQHQLFVRFWRADWEMLMRVFRLGVPIGFTGLSETGLFTATAVMMGWLGTVPLAAHGIALQCAGITFMLHLGISNVATIRAGNAFGRGDREHLAKGAYVVFAMSLVAALLAVVGFLLWPEPLVLAFMQPSEPARDQILVIGVGLLAMAALFQLVDGAQVIALGLLRGVQDTKVPMYMAAFSYWGIGMPCSYILGFVLGYEGIGVWMGLVVGLASAAILLSVRFWSVILGRVGTASDVG